MHFIPVETFDDWRLAARTMIVGETPPHEIRWTAEPSQLSLFDETKPDQPQSVVQSPETSATFSVPKNFIELARNVACHRSPIRFEVLYRVLWRLAHGEKHLLSDASDDDVLTISKMQKNVTRDVHKMKAFVRFRKVIDVEGVENFIAWHRPDHRIVRLTAPFFARRFKGMNWSILTPDESVAWDQNELRYGAGVPVTEAPDSDELEALWLTYYASIFNPARVKVAMMKSEMPVRHWRTMPETAIIDDLLRKCPPASRR